MFAVEISHELTSPFLRDILAFFMDWSMRGMYVVPYLVVENIALHDVA